MKFSTTILFLFLTVWTVNAQKEDRNWVFGINAGIDFNNLSNPSTFVSNIRSAEVSASISDSQGNLLFYIANQDVFGNLSWILDKTNMPIINGDSLLPLGTSTNGALILPPINNSNKYYLFYTGICFPPTCPTANYHLYYAVIQNSNDTLKVIEKNTLIVQEPIEERLAAVKHANGKDWWILLHRHNDNGPCTNRTYRILLTENGPVLEGYQDIGTLHCSYPQSSTGELVFSRNGNIVASAIGGQGTVDLFDFDRCSGTLSNHRSIDISDAILLPYSCEFSSSGDILYVSGWVDDDFKFSNLYQYDLRASVIESSRVTIWESPTWGLDVGQLQIAPDDKIYYSSWFIWVQDSAVENKYLSVINSPDSIGIACDFQPFSFYLGDSSWTTYALPNMPNYNLSPINLDSCVTMTSVFNNEQIPFKVYPNPATDNLTIEGLKSTSTFQLYDLLGREVLATQLTTGKNQIETKNLTNGIYIYRVTGESKVGKVFIEK